jgi:hypothetical protein
MLRVWIEKKKPKVPHWWHIYDSFQHYIKSDRSFVKNTSQLNTFPTFLSSIICPIHFRVTSPLSFASFQNRPFKNYAPLEKFVASIFRVLSGLDSIFVSFSILCYQILSLTISNNIGVWLLVYLMLIHQFCFTFF